MLNRIKVIAVFFVFLSSFAFAEGGVVREFERRFSIGGKIPGALIIVGWSNDAREIAKLADFIITKVGETHARLDWQNPSSDVARLNAASGSGPVEVSGDVISAFEAARKLSEWTDGAFDIAYAGRGTWKNIRVRKKESTVELKKKDMSVRFDPIIAGFLAEMTARYIAAGGMNNALIKIGSSFRGVGNSPSGPWRIQIQDSDGATAPHQTVQGTAYHGLELSIGNTGVATVSAAQFKDQPLINPKTKEEIVPPCKGAVVVASDAAFAAGIANTAFILGPAEGPGLISKFGKGIIIDNEGKFHRSAGF